MPNALILGAGMVGSVMAADMAADPEFDVSIADLNPDALARAKGRAPSVSPLEADLSDRETLRRLIEPFDIVLGALSSCIGLATLRTIIEAGKHYADISFMPQDPLALDELAQTNGVTAVVDIGVAPGMSNLLAAASARELDTCTNIEIYVGGLPQARHWPYDYKAGFSPADVIEEYTRPSRLVEHGNIVVREALSEPELMEFPGLGTLEAFNTDGLRSLADTLDIPFMKEKTLRYPGHIELMRVLRDTGLFSHEPVAINRRGDTVRPIDLTSALLFPKWTYKPGEEDLTVMRIIVDGTKGDADVRITWDLDDRFDRDTNTTSMARTTAFPCAAVARMIMAGEITRRGVVVPEFLAEDEATTDRILGAMGDRGITYNRSEHAL